jgi:myo-inositol-1(or 4)-monophosphatase
MINLNLNDILKTIEAVARDAGGMLHTAYYQPRQIDYKGEVNLVTQTDRDTEKAIVEALRAQYPDIAIQAEEGSAEVGADNLIWLIDPLDGTNNFVHGFPVFVVSIALYDGSEPLAGVVYDPLGNEMFSAARGQGAMLNGEAIQVAGASDLVHSLLATGFAYDRHEAIDNNIIALSRFLRTAQGIRRAGAAALDLAYVACGRLDGYWEMTLHPWDIAAGLLLVREAGGIVTTYAGQPDDDSLIRAGSIVASNRQIHPAMLDVLAGVYDFAPDGCFTLKAKYRNLNL